jgi:hypothetical protein
VHMVSIGVSPKPDFRLLALVGSLKLEIRNQAGGRRISFL